LSHWPEPDQIASDGTPPLGGLVVGAVVGAVVGVVVGVVVGAVVGLVVPPALPVQATPFRVKDVGAGLLPVHEPLKPNEAVPLVPSAPFQLAFLAVTVEPLWVAAVFQAEVIVWPAANDQTSDHEVRASPRLVIVTLAPKPPAHEFCTV
jgi:hypothetical protein